MHGSTGSGGGGRRRTRATGTDDFFPDPAWLTPLSVLTITREGAYDLILPRIVE
jgi:hypothetical protein